jgi:hypothetical protein
MKRRALEIWLDTPLAVAPNSARTSIPLRLSRSQRFSGTATFVHAGGDEIVYTEKKEAFWELAYYGHAR